MKKRIFSLAAALICLALMLVACNAPAEAKATTLVVTGYKAVFEAGEEFSAGDLVVEALYDDKSTKTLEKTQYEVDYSAFNSSEAGSYNVVVKALGLTANYSVEVKAPIVCTAIEFVSGKTQFEAGEEFSVGDLVVKATYSDGQSKNVPAADLSVDSASFNSDVAGVYTITITAYGKQASYEVVVNKKAAVATELKITGYKTIFEADEEFSAGDLVVEALYDDDTTKTLEKTEYEVDYSAFNSSEAGSYNVVVKALGLTANYSVEVKARVVCTALEFVSGKTQFELDDEFDCDDVVLKATFSNGEVKEVPETEVAVDSTDFNGAKIGVYTILLSAYGKQVSYEVNVTSRTSLKLLMIGNSFSEDAVKWVYDIAKDLGITDVNVCNMYIGGCSLDTHYNNAVNNSANYDLQVYQNGTWVHNNNKTLLDGLKYADWDYVSLQQSSGVSGIDTSYSKLQGLIEYVRKNATNPNVKLAWHMTWAYSANSTHGDFAKYDKDQMKMYNAIVDCVGTQVLTKSFHKVIPNGTAIQNARTSYVGDTLTRDGYHLSLDMGRYIAGLNLVYTLTGADITKIKYAPSGVSDGYKKVAIESVINSAEKPYVVSQSKYLTEPDPITIEEIESKNLVKMNYLPVGSAFYNASDSVNYNKLLTNVNNLSPKFVTTAKRFTKEELPVGSVIILKQGWQYRPEAWVDDAYQATRPNNVTARRVDVDEAWWGNYKYRAFNIAKVGSPLLDGEFTQAADALTIYVPKGTPLATAPDYSDGDAEILSANGKDISKMKQLDLMPIVGFYNSNVTEKPLLQLGSLNDKFVSSDVLTKETLPVGSMIIIDKDYQCRPDAWVLGTKTAKRPDTVAASNQTAVIDVTEQWWGQFDTRTLIVAKIGMPIINQTPYEVFKHVRVYVPNN